MELDGRPDSSDTIVLEVEVDQEPLSGDNVGVDLHAQAPKTTSSDDSFDFPVVVICGCAVSLLCCCMFAIFVLWRHKLSKARSSANSKADTQIQIGSSKIGTLESSSSSLRALALCHTMVGDEAIQQWPDSMFPNGAPVQQDLEFETIAEETRCLAAAHCELGMSPSPPTLPHLRRYKKIIICL